jgi:hypothetical protein
MWVWTGLAYHALFFAPINKAANAFAALFVVQGLLFAHASLARSDLRFSREHGLRAWLGWALIVYSALIYPLIGFAGHGYLAMRCSASRPLRSPLQLWCVAGAAAGAAAAAAHPLVWALAAAAPLSCWRCRRTGS